MTSDGDLLTAWQAGDKAAGGELIDRYFEPLRRFFQGKLNEGVEDMIQETLLACVQRRDQIRDPAAFRGYLFAAARTKLYDRLRARGRPDRPVDFAVSSIAEIAQTGLSPSSVLGAREDERLLGLALRQLPIDLQIALELYYFERVRGRDLEIALAVPPGTVRSRLRRGLEILRKKIDELAANPETSAQARRDTEASIARWADSLSTDCESGSGSGSGSASEG